MGITNNPQGVNTERLSEDDLQRVADVVTNLIGCITERYAPAATPQDATSTMSTVDIFRAIVNARPDVKISMSDIPPLMEVAGYRLGIPVGQVGCVLHWLLRDK